jgi:hypothetical protein
LDDTLNAPVDIQNQFNDLLNSNELFQFIGHLSVADPLRVSLSKIGLRSDQLFCLDLLIDDRALLNTLISNRGVDKAAIHVMVVADRLVRPTGLETLKLPTRADVLLSTNRSVFHAASSILLYYQVMHLLLIHHSNLLT